MLPSAAARVSLPFSATAFGMLAGEDAGLLVAEGAGAGVLMLPSLLRL